MIKSPFALVVLSLALCGEVSAATGADDVETSALPKLALNPPAAPIWNSHSSSIWSGFYTGSDAFPASGNNMRGYVGGVGFASVPSSARFASSFSGHAASKTYGDARAAGKVGDDIAGIMRAAAAGSVLGKSDPGSSTGNPNGGNALSNLRNAPTNVKIRGTDIEIGAHMNLNIGIIGNMSQAGTDR